ncbi:hypothetical protein SCHPADRAFT_890949 [Schizopora paradoxa]|uniref:Cupredoxin n=1 Tax=Schizopora paradoxa TaxID=27342 RepID=A0A0H2S5V7_9AGAM|nr:hypothetical protein SCHPADRAFT_890949 [Schizopora paradoxa]
MGFSAGWLLTGLSALGLARAQLTQTVSVGTFYSPPLIAAPGVNDTIVFLFMSGVHGVTQSSLEQPCAQLSGGFNSGLIKGDPNNPPSWNLTITNVTEPIWYMCQALQPFSHCANGMVGAINAPVDEYANFTAGAKTLTSTPAPVTDMVLTGQGAFATNPPITPSITSNPATTTTAPSSETVTETSSSSKSSNIGAIVGGAVGGAAVLCVLGGFIFFMCCSRHRHRHEQPQKAEPFAIETSQKYDGHGLVADSKNAQYLATQRTGPGSDANGSAAGGGAYQSSSPTPIYGNAFGPTDQHLAYHNQMMMGGAGGYARSEPASDTQERERDRDRDMMPQMAGPSSSPNMQQTFQSTSDPRFSAVYSDYAQGPRPSVRDIAKEVADLLLPQLRANESGSPPPPSQQQQQQQLGGQQAANNANASNPTIHTSINSRNPDGHPRYAPSVFSTSDADRTKSPAPPEYS